jgi:hypothetical protein
VRAELRVVTADGVTPMRSAQCTIGGLPLDVRNLAEMGQDFFCEKELTQVFNSFDHFAAF